VLTKKSGGRQQPNRIEEPKRYQWKKNFMGSKNDKGRGGYSIVLTKVGNPVSPGEVENRFGAAFQKTSNTQQGFLFKKSCIALSGLSCDG
jgi:hypothetical protein